MNLPGNERMRNSATRTGPSRLRLAAVIAVFACSGLAVAAQILRLATTSEPAIKLASIEPLTRNSTRPDIVDRRGRLIATDIQVPSLYVDPAQVLDVDEVVNGLAEALPDLDIDQVRGLLADRTRRFVWIRRGIPPRTAQAIHDMGLPGVGLRQEPRRMYPQGALAGHLIGHVGFDNQGVTGLEKWIDDTEATAARDPRTHRRAPVRLTLDLGVQYGLEAELVDATRRYAASAASGVLMDITTGAIVASASVPGVDPQRPAQFQEEARLDRVAQGTYELGSILKSVTVAMALEAGKATPDTMFDVRQPLRAGRYMIRDLHPAGRPLSLREIFVHSSNVGAGMLALEAGPDKLRAFLDRLGLTTPLRTEAGAVATPRLPAHWGRAETITVAYGHGLALAPLHFASAASSLVNGGFQVKPTLNLDATFGVPHRERVLSARTSKAMVELMRRNVTHPKGTGRRADVAGMEIGGKTGTAELPARGGYEEHRVISSFLAVWPAAAPRYLLLLSIFEPQPSGETAGQITAGQTAAPAAGRLITRVAPLLTE